MKCPFCETEMLQGYFQTGAAIWSERKHKLSLNPDSKEKYAFRLKVPLTTPNSIESWCCPNCKKLIIDTSEYEHRL